MGLLLSSLQVIITATPQDCCHACGVVPGMLALSATVFEACRANFYAFCSRQPAGVTFVLSAGCSGFQWSQDIDDSASYRQCSLKRDLPRLEHDVRYVSGMLHSFRPIAPAVSRS